LEPEPRDNYRERVSWPQSVRRTVAAAVAAVAWLLSMALAGQPAQAHGAMANPISRAMACGAEGGAAAASAACRAAVAASDGAMAFDNVRVPNVNGRDRQRIPDGRLCSGGLTRYKGLDLARTDWPATVLAAGARFTFRYRATIPHRGSFRLYVTRDGYRPTRPLRWADLETKPFLTVANPMIQNGSYLMTGRLPAGRTGHHIIYTIWRTTSTADTYYSCSDVFFTGAGATASAPATQRNAVPGASPVTTAPMDATSAPVAAVSHPNPTLPILVSVGAGLVGGAVVLVIWNRRLDPSRQAARARNRPRPGPQA
jgi:predicted carbohydrate-binding protein with CBM5 and CBM33 domain